MRPCKGGLCLVLAAVLALAAQAAPAGAATSVYPAGGGGFEGSAEGWEVTEASCNVPLSARRAAAMAVATVARRLARGEHEHHPQPRLALPLDRDPAVAGLHGRGWAAATLHLERRFAPGSLVDLAPATVVGPAQMKGKRLFVKARCPRAVGRACRIAVRGLLSRRKPATAQRRVKVPAGKAKRVALRVKPRAKGKLASHNRLLFRIRVRAGGAQATTVKRLRLIRR
jgi:hypothetical protein